MSRIRNSSRSGRSGSLNPRDISRARAMAGDIEGQLGEVVGSVQTNTVKSIMLDSSSVSKETDPTGRNIGVLFILLQVNTSVQQLKIRDIDLNQEGMWKLVAAALTFNRSIKELSLERVNMEAEGLSIVTNAIKRNANIQTLSISGNPFGDKGSDSIPDLVTTTSMRIMTLEDNEFTDSALCALARALSSSSLKELHIGRNRFAFGRVKYYDVDTNRMVSGIELLGEALEKHSTIETLDFSGNREVLKYSMAPLWDHLKLNNSLTYINISNCKLTNRMFLTLAEFCIACKNTRRTIQLTNCGADASSMREVAALRIKEHQVELKGVKFEGVANSDERHAQLVFIVHLLSRPHEPVFPHSASELFVLMDGRNVTLNTEKQGQIRNGSVKYTLGDVLQFQRPSSSTDIAKHESIKLTYPTRTTGIMLNGKYTMHSNVIQKLIATGASLVNIVDYSLDIVILSQLALAGDWTIFWISFAALLWANIYICYSLLGDGRRFAAFLHLFGLTAALDAYFFVIKGEKPNSTIVLKNSQPMQGLAVSTHQAIQRLKLLESLLESSLQIIFQSFILLQGRISGELILSIAVSFVSIFASVTQSDRQKIAAWSSAEGKPWISTLSCSIIFLGFFRGLEVLSNIATVSTALTYLPFSPAITVGAILGFKLLFTIIYWRGNLQYLGEVVSSIFVSPGTQRITYDWVKDAKRLPVWYYIALQVCFDVLVLVALRIIDGSDIPSVVYFICVGVVSMKYVSAILLWTLHNLCEEFIYTDRRHILTCGILKKKQVRKRGIEEMFVQDNPASPRKELMPSHGNWFKAPSSNEEESAVRADTTEVP